jgi:hypothetical protein
MKHYLISALVFFLLFCTKQPVIDNNLYGLWLYMGYKDMAAGMQVDAKSYSVPNSLKAYRIGSNSLTQFTRGVDYSSSPMGGSIEFFDSIQTDDYSVKLTENSDDFVDVKRSILRLSTQPLVSILSKESRTLKVGPFVA